MTKPHIDLVERKALLVTRAELDRARVLLAIREIKNVVAPVSTAERATRYRPVAAMLMGVLGPTMGASRLANWLRAGWIVLAAIRVLRTLR